MKLYDILTNKKIALPIIQTANFVDELTRTLDEFIALVNLLDDDDFEISSIYVQQPYVIKGILNLFKIGLLKTIEIYLDGKGMRLSL